MIDETLARTAFRTTFVRNLASVGYSREEIAQCLLGADSEPTAAHVAMVVELYRGEIEEGEATLRANQDRMSPSRRLWRRAEAGDADAIHTLVLQHLGPGPNSHRPN